MCPCVHEYFYLMFKFCRYVEILLCRMGALVCTFSITKSKRRRKNENHAKTTEIFGKRICSHRETQTFECKRWWVTKTSMACFSSQRCQHKIHITSHYFVFFFFFSVFKMWNYGNEGQIHRKTSCALIHHFIVIDKSNVCIYMVTSKILMLVCYWRAPIRS